MSTLVLICLLLIFVTFGQWYTFLVLFVLFCPLLSIFVHFLTARRSCGPKSWKVVVLVLLHHFSEFTLLSAANKQRCSRINFFDKSKISGQIYDFWTNLWFLFRKNLLRICVQSHISRSCTEMHFQSCLYFNFRSDPEFRFFNFSNLLFQFLSAPIKLPISNLPRILFATSTSSLVVAIIKSVSNYTQMITRDGANACKASISRTME